MMEKERFPLGIDLTNLADNNDDGWVKLTNKFKSKCCVCGEVVKQGTDVLWKRGSGIRHVENCYDVEEVTTTEDLIVIEEDEWKDFNKYSLEVLRKIDTCQRCGRRLDKTKHTFINVDRRTCERCAFK